jgi:hypothetical protein
MQVKRLPFLTIALGLVVGITAFGSNSFVDLYNTRIASTKAADSPANPMRMITVATGSSEASGPTVQAVELIPAPQLPTRLPDKVGLFSRLDGNILSLQSFLTASTGADGRMMFGAGVIEGAPAGATLPGATIISGTIAAPLEWNLPRVAPLPDGVLPSSGPVSDNVTLVYGGSIASIPSSQGGGTSAAGSEIFTAAAIANIPSSQGGETPANLIWTVTTDPDLAQAAPQKVVVTDATRIFHDITTMPTESSTDVTKIQQMLQAGSLDDLAGHTMVSVWGHMDGEQLIADVIVYQNPFPIQ